MNMLRKMPGIIALVFELGACIAVVISWSINKSILWAIVHSQLSWLYVAYYAIVR